MVRSQPAPATPTEFEMILGLIGGGGCAVIAIVNAGMGYWSFALVFAIVATPSLRTVWQYVRARDIEPDSEPPHGEPNRG